MPSDATPPRQSKLAAALALAELGFPVFPLIPNDKRPLIAGWQRLATATDLERIREWWASEPDANIGIPTENLFVVDVDPRKGGASTLQALKLTEEFPESVASVTAGGGVHLVFALPGESVSGGNDLLGQGIDVKSHGGFIVAPGSTIGGKSYKWVPDHDPISIKPAPAPDWMLAHARRTVARSDVAGTTVVDEDDAAIARAEHWLAKHAPEAVEGERDNKAFTVAAKLYDFGLRPDTAREYLAQWNEAFCHPSLDNDDIDRIVSSAAKNRQTAIGSRHPDAPGFDVYTIDEAKAPPSPSDMEGRPAKRAKFHLVQAAEGARRALDMLGEPLIEGIFHRKAMSVLIGAPGGGKTFLVLDWSYHIAAGKPWADRPVKQGAVVYLAAEAGGGIMARLKALETHYGPLNDIPLYVIPCPADFAHGEEDAAAITRLILDLEKTTGKKVEFFVVDTLNRAIAGGDESSSKDVGALIRNVDRIRDLTGVHALIIHHPGKDETKGGRGHSSVLGAVDTEMIISNKTLSFTKQRDMPMGPPIGFALKPIQIGVDARGAAVSSCYVEPRKGSADERAPLSSELSEIMEYIEAGLAERDEGDISKSFGWQFVREKVSCLSRYLSTDKLPVRTTVLTWLSEMSAAGWVKKVGRNQWVMTNVGNVENVENDLD